MRSPCSKITTKIVHFAPQSGDGYRASALWNAAAGRAIVLSSGLAQKPGSNFELWIIEGEGRSSAGRLPALAPRRHGGR